MNARRPEARASTRLRYRLLLADVDGTLVGETDTLSPRTRAALRAAQQAGCAVALCTGRSRYTARRVAAQIGGQQAGSEPSRPVHQAGGKPSRPVHRYGIVLNGAVLVDWEHERVLRRTTLPPGAAREAIRLVHACGAAPLCMGTEEEDRWVHTDRRFPVYEGYLQYNAARMVYHDDLETAAIPPPVSVSAFAPHATIRALTDSLRAAFGETVRLIESASPRYPCGIVEVYAADAGKASAAAALAAMLGVPREQTLAIGDQVNDLDLLRWAGMGVCMGDGVEEARACADHVTGALREDGAAQAIERFILQPHEQE